MVPLCYNDAGSIQIIQKKICLFERFFLVHCTGQYETKYTYTLLLYKIFQLYINENLLRCISSAFNNENRKISVIWYEF